MTSFVPRRLYAVLLGVASWSALSAAQEPQAAAGAALFQRSCASCHNVEGRAPSLSTGVFAHGGEDAQIAQTIRSGVPGTQMPPFPALSPEAIAQLVAYIRSIAPNAPRPAAAPTTVAPAPNLTYERLLHAASEPHNWLTYWGDYQGTHYSRLSQIIERECRPASGRVGEAVAGQLRARSDAARRRRRDVHQRPARRRRRARRASGRQIWRYQRAQKVRNPNEINPFSRGVAILGNRLFVGTLDAALVALDARTGTLLWEVQIADTMQGFSLTSPPLPVKDKIITGIAGGEFGIRGFIDAYDPATGKRLWRFSTIPGPANSATRRGPAIRGSSVAARPGCLAPTTPSSTRCTGRRQTRARSTTARHARATICSRAPSSRSIQRPVNASGTSSSRRTTPTIGTRTRTWCWSIALFHGQPRKLLMHADRNGHFYVLDRTNGAFLSGDAVRGADLEPRLRREGPALADGRLAAERRWHRDRAGIGGGTNFQAPSYSAETGLLYLAYQESQPALLHGCASV